MAITKEQIFQVADELDAAGQNPTLAGVRKALGGGSFTTISEGMSEWRSRKAAEAAPLRDPAPQAVTDKMTEMGGELWAVALELANARLASEREALEAVRVEMEGTRLEAVELADQLTREMDDTKAHMAALEAQIGEVRAEADEQRQNAATLGERAATAEIRAEEIEHRARDLRTELDHAHKEADQIRDELRRSQDATKQAEVDSKGIQAAAAEERNRLADELAVVKAELKAQNEQHQEQRKHVAQETARQAERFTKVKAERDEARIEVRRIGEKTATLRGRVEALEVVVASNSLAAKS